MTSGDLRSSKIFFVAHLVTVSILCHSLDARGAEIAAIGVGQASGILLETPRIRADLQLLRHHRAISMALTSIS